VRLVLVSENAHKARELAAALPGWEVLSWTGPPLPPETGATFRENARGKAAFGREHADPEAWVVGEDSGLEVTGLGGRPGILSARYAGDRAGDAANVAKLLDELDGLEPRSRAARYVCALVALPPGGREVAVEGTLEGAIADESRGAEGFGYDPVFVPEGEARTVAELGNAWKAKRSHRAQAARALAEALGRGADTV
jgi:XTP/dITP diphosphohydrolase